MFTMLSLTVGKPPSMIPSHHRKDHPSSLFHNAYLRGYQIDTHK